MIEIPEGMRRKINFNGPLFKGTPCWEWTGRLDNNGYGQTTETINNKKKSCRIHRKIFRVLTGERNEKLTLDHLCRNRKCCNPDHLEQVTLKDNVLRGIGPTAINNRKKKCNRGHLLSGKNLKICVREDGSQGRLCIECTKNRLRSYADKNKKSLAEYQKKYQEKNTKSLKEYKRIWYLKKKLQKTI